MHRGLHALGSALSLLGWDQETFMPPAAVEHRAAVRSHLAGLAHDGTVDPAFGDWRDVEKIVADNPDNVEKYRGGKDSLIGWFVGQVMRESRGKADPNAAREVLDRVTIYGIEPGTIIVVAAVPMLGFAMFVVGRFLHNNPVRNVIMDF